MLHLPVIRWGQRYESLETAAVDHFLTGEPIARLSLANSGLVLRDQKKGTAARDALRQLGSRELIQGCERAAELFLAGELPMGLSGETQSADAFVRAQSGSTGLPESMCRANMRKIHFVLSHMGGILDALTRGLDLEIFARGHGVEARKVLVSYQAQSPILGAVLPSNSPGVHSLWLPAIPLFVGLMLKPGSAEPWTPYRIVAAWRQAGIPPESMGLYPGEHDVGNAILSQSQRAMIFGSEKTVEQYAGNSRVQVHGPGFSKILLGDDEVDHWQDHLDLMVESIVANGGRSCINCSAIYASRHTAEIAEALSQRLGPIEVKPPEDPDARLAAFVSRDMARGTWSLIEADLQEAGVRDGTASYGLRLVELDRCAYLRPMIVHADSPQRRIARREFMFPFTTVVTCPQQAILREIGPTLVATAITHDDSWIEDLTQARSIDRLNIGPIPTTHLNWYQPHEGNLVDFLYRSRAYQHAGRSD